MSPTMKNAGNMSFSSELDGGRFSNHHELISMAESNIHELEQAIELTKYQVLNESYIVRIGPVFITFDVHPQSKIISNPRPSRPDHCVRMELEDAENVAQLLMNDEGEEGVAVHLKDALAEALAGQRMFLDMLKQSFPVA